MSDIVYTHVPSINDFDVKYYFNLTSYIYEKKSFPLHIDDRLEVYVLIEGDVSFVVESTVYKLSSGDAIITRPNERHHCIINSKSPHRHFCFWFDPSCPFIFSEFLSHDFGKNNLLSPDADGKARLFDILDGLKDAAAENDTLRQFHLMLEMLHIYRGSIKSSLQPTQTMPPLLTVILADIDKNFCEIHDLEHITSKYYISPSTLNRLFKRYLQTTPKRYLESKKLAHSRTLLKKNSSVLSAYMRSGFTDYANYIRLFKKRFGITPGQYRSNIQSSQTSFKQYK